MSFLIKRTHRLNELSSKNISDKVRVMGWVAKVRNLGNMIFVDLRDRYSTLQVVFEEELLAEAAKLRNEFVIGVEGVVRERPQGMINTKMLTGSIEVKADSLVVLNKCGVLPFQITDTDISEHLRLKYRYLDLRREKMRRNIIERARFTRIVREELENEDFLDIETPYLQKSTPEGARDFVVPSRIHNGKFFALPQSPQQYKQILMIAGFDRYYQLAKCFRDEDLRADRQPEFTQIDCEMSFIDQDELLDVFESIMKKIISRFKNKKVEELFPAPLTRMTYKDSVDYYGTDKPDIRFENKLVDISDTVRGKGFKVFDDILEAGGIVNALCFKDSGSYFTRKVLDNLMTTSKDYGLAGLSWAKKKEDLSWSSPIAKYFDFDTLATIEEKTGFSAEGDTLIIGAGPYKKTKWGLGGLRNFLAKELNLYDKNELKLLWVVEFPMFEQSEEDGRISAAHHPFTSPFREDMEYLFSDPLRVRSRAYDMVLNGVELASGSIRIHDPDTQSKVFEAIGLTRKEIESKFGFLIEAFKYGAPPHGGIAFGLDRLLMLLLGEESIKEVIPFPKTNKAQDLMSGAPGTVSDKDLDDLGIKITRMEEESSDDSE